MDIGYTYGSPDFDRLSVYVPPDYEPPESFTVTRDGTPVRFVRLSDRELECGATPGVKGSCTSFDCHRMVIGECICKRHRSVHSPDPDPADPDADMRPKVRLKRAVS